MHRFKLLATLAVLGALLAVPALAADNGFYLGGSVGQTSVDFNTETSDVSGDDTSYKVFGGFRFITFLGVEGSYVDFGTPEEVLEAAGGAYEADITGLDAFAVGYLPLGIADIFVKYGVIDWDTDITSTLDGGSETQSNSGTDPAYGAGVQFRIRSFAIRGEVEYFDIESADNVYMYSLGGSYTF